MTRARAAIYGPEPWVEVADVNWSHWDGWFCYVVVVDHAGNWDELRDDIVARCSRHGSTDWQAKLSHIDDLTARLTSVGICPDELAQLIGDDRVTTAKARRKVLTQPVAGGRDATEPMVHTPARRLRRRALFGRFDLFPVSPEPTAELFADICVEERSSYRVAAAWEEAISELDAAATNDPAARLAIWRGYVAAGIDAFYSGLQDDGTVGMTLAEAFFTYAGLPWQVDGFSAENYYADLVELIVWEDWGLRYRRNAAPYCGVSPDEVELIERLLRQTEAELRGYRLNYHADEARQQIAWLHVAARTFDRFVDDALMLGGDHWMPIVALAESAIESGDPELAADVFGAATSKPGDHRDFLISRAQALARERIH